MATVSIAPGGRCIYCGSDGGPLGLRDEHIVPFALNGTSILPKASCSDCEAITSAFEGRCARTMYGSFRMRENLRTRRPKERPKELRVEARFGDKAKPFVMPIAGVVATLPLVHFLPPGYLRSPRIKQIGWTGVRLETKTDGPRDKTAWSKSAASSFSFIQRFDVDALALMLAKIAHATCIERFGFNFFDPWLPPYILGKDRALSYLVGGANKPLEPVNKLHEIQYTAAFNETAGEWLASVDIRLFAQFGGPDAQVIVGQTSEELVRSCLV